MKTLIIFTALITSLNIFAEETVRKAIVLCEKETKLLNKKLSEYEGKIKNVSAPSHYEEGTEVCVTLLFEGKPTTRTPSSKKKIIK